MEELDGQLLAQVAVHFEDWVPHAVQEIFDGSPAVLADELSAFCRSELGSDVGEMEFLRVSVGCAAGLRLADGRRVVVKALRPGTRPERLAAIQRVQGALSSEGFPCPAPLADPVPLGAGVGIAETLLDDGEPADAHDERTRDAMALALAELIRRCRPFGLSDELRGDANDGLWPRPHDGRFDFEATTRGAEWIDEIAREALAADDGSGEPVVGHGDWRAENMRFGAGAVTAVYDWDSLVIAREPKLVGAAAHQFTADYTREDRQQLPTLAETRAFVAAYERARGQPFTAHESRVANAALVYSMAYAARCAHSDLLTDLGRQPARAPANVEPAEGSAAAFLRDHAEELLAP
jgi:Phosphotransferase enzyme family